MTVYETLQSIKSRNLRFIADWSRDSKYGEAFANRMIADYEMDNRALDIAMQNLPVKVAEQEIDG